MVAVRKFMLSRAGKFFVFVTYIKKILSEFVPKVKLFSLILLCRFFLALYD